MSELQINLNDDGAAFKPGEELTGTVCWQTEKPARAIELRLFWFTRGRGTEDAAVVETLRFEQPLQSDTRSFRFRLPDGPCSFSGQLISLVWALELIVERSKQVARKEIIVGPDGEAIQLGSVDSPLGILRVPQAGGWAAGRG